VHAAGRNATHRLHRRPCDHQRDRRPDGRADALRALRGELTPRVLRPLLGQLSTWLITEPLRGAAALVQLEPELPSAKESTSPRRHLWDVQRPALRPVD